MNVRINAHQSWIQEDIWMIKLRILADVQQQGDEKLANDKKKREKNKHKNSYLNIALTNRSPITRSQKCARARTTARKDECQEPGDKCLCSVLTNDEISLTFPQTLMNGNVLAIRAPCCGFVLCRYRGFCEWPLRLCHRWCAFAFVFVYFICTFVCNAHHISQIYWVSQPGSHFFSTFIKTIFAYFLLALFNSLQQHQWAALCICPIS